MCDCEQFFEARSLYLERMTINVTRQPSGSVDGLSLTLYRVGRSYEVDALLGQYLVMEGYAVIEMRRRQRSARFRSNDRRSNRVTTAP